MINFATLRNLSLFTIIALSILPVSVIADNSSNVVETSASMSDLDQLFNQASIEIKYPMTVFFDEEGMVSLVHHPTRQQSSFEGESNPSASKSSTGNISRADILASINPSFELNSGDFEALLFVINEQICTACGTEKEALEAFAQRHPETHFGIVYVEFQ